MPACANVVARQCVVDARRLHEAVRATSRHQLVTAINRNDGDQRCNDSLGEAMRWSRPHYVQCCLVWSAGVMKRLDASTQPCGCHWRSCTVVPGDCFNAAVGVGCVGLPGWSGI